MQTITHLIELFEKDPLFWKEWNTNAVLASKNRNLFPLVTEQKKLRKLIDSLKIENPLKKRVKLFGM